MGHSTEHFLSSGALWVKRVRYAFDPMNTTYTWNDIDWFDRCVGRYLPAHSALPEFPIHFGRIGMVEAET